MQFYFQQKNNMSSESPLVASLYLQEVLVSIFAQLEGNIEKASYLNNTKLTKNSNFLPSNASILMPKSRARKRTSRDCLSPYKRKIKA